MSRPRDRIAQPARDPARSARAEIPAARDQQPAITTAADPRLAVASIGMRSDLMGVQRTAGNAAAASLVAPAVQRVVAIDEVAAEVDPSPPQTDAGSPSGSSPAAAPPAPEADHTITAAHIGLNAPMVEAPGIIRAQTVIADSIVASSYTPGAGNQW